MAKFEEKEDAGVQSTRWLSKGFEELVAQIEAPGADPETHIFDVLIIGSGYGGSIAASELAGRVRQIDEKQVPLRIAVLERGNEYLSGTFSKDFSELPAHIRISSTKSKKPKGNTEGLLDVRINRNINAVVANGLGGGSLINAGVMEIPDPEIFNARQSDGSNSPWPESINMEEMEYYFDEIKRQLGATVDGADNNVTNSNSADRFQKYQFMKGVGLPGDCTFRDSAITIALKDRTNDYGVRLNKCIGCGDCATGCNHGAKESLDRNLLVNAQAKGVELYTGATVLHLSNAQDGIGNRIDDIWQVHTVYTNDLLRKRASSPTIIRARKVILSAGALGSTEILKRSEAVANSPEQYDSSVPVQDRLAPIRFSPLLGKRFSTNGDMMAVGYKHRDRVNAVADPEQNPGHQDIGPTNTAIIQSNEPGRPRLIIEELAVPNSLSHFFNETFATVNTLHQLSKIDKSVHRAGVPESDPFTIGDEAKEHSSLYAIIGDDGAKGELILNDDITESETEKKETWDGSIKMEWPGIGDEKLFQYQIDRLSEILNQSNVGGTLIPNPGWQLLPKDTQYLLNNKTGSLLTVHPLGGCTMGDSASVGVVDQYGQCFVYPSDSNPTQTATDNLIVLDGAIIPSAIATNPALTISAVCLRAIRHLRDDVWRFPEGDSVTLSTRTPPTLRKTDVKPSVRETKIRITERLIGETHLRTNTDEEKRVYIELLLSFRDHKALSLIAHGNNGVGRKLRTRKPNPKQKRRQCQLRIYDYEKAQDILGRDLPLRRKEEALEEHAMLAKADVQGSIEVLARGQTTMLRRILVGARAWILNRGLRDTYQFVFPKDYEKDATEEHPEYPNVRGFGVSYFLSELKTKFLSAPTFFKSIWNRILSGIRLSSHAGEIRLMNYRLHLTKVYDLREIRPSFNMDSPFPLAVGQAITGSKKFTYSRKSNPWRQLARVHIDEFPARDQKKPTREFFLDLDLGFLASRGIPLIQIAQQDNQPKALADVASVALYIIRMIIDIHLWSFRMPDVMRPTEPNRLAGKIPGCPEPIVSTIEVDRIPDSAVESLPAGSPVTIRLTRYLNSASIKPPVLLIHGYSTSSTCFAHPAIENNLTQFLWNEGSKVDRDVWLLDLRTSSGMKSALYPWSFEEVAFADIPAAIDHIYRITGQKVDVIAHCMGAVMFSMSVLGSSKDISQRLAILNGRNSEFLKKLERSHRGLPDRINSLVLSQAGPLPVFTAGNIFRSYLASYLMDFLPLEDYSFKPSKNSSVTEQLIDRTCYTIPYPEEEFSIENPAWPPCKRTPYTGVRHRMDALYNRSFSLKNVPDGVLEHIDDLFGPLSIGTLTQTIHFAKHRIITTKQGLNTFFSRSTLNSSWTFPTLAVHARDNGLLDFKTLNRSKRQIVSVDQPNQTATKSATREISGFCYDGMGHQDTYIGGGPARETKEKTFEVIRGFLDHNHESGQYEAPDCQETPDTVPIQLESDSGARNEMIRVRTPYSGPIKITGQDSIMIKSGDHPALGANMLTLLLPVELVRHDKDTKRYFILGKGGRITHPDIEDYAREAHIVLVDRSDTDDGWFSFNVDKDYISELNPDVQELLVLCLYNQDPGLEGNLVFDILNPTMDAAFNKDEFFDGSPALDVSLIQVQRRLMELGIEYDLTQLLLGKAPTLTEHQQANHEIQTNSPLTAITPQQVDLIDFLVTKINEQMQKNRNVLLNSLNDAMNRDSDRLESGTIPVTAQPNVFGGDRFCFALGSCQYPAGLLDDIPSFSSFRRLKSRIESTESDSSAVLKPSALFLLGDQVYIDAKAGLFDPRSIDDRFSVPYRSLFRKRPVRDVLRRLDSHLMLDDHEIENNWQPADDHSRNGDDVFKSGVSNYVKHQRPDNPSSSLLWKSIRYGDLPFFILDTRTLREARSIVTVESCSILGTSGGQFDEVEKWLKDQPRNVPKFILSPVSILPRHAEIAHSEYSPLRSDSWDGYPGSLYRLLDFILREKVRNVVFLSGDEHLSCHLESFISRDEVSVKIDIFISSGMYSPYPFANTMAEKLLLKDEFCLNGDNGGIHCKVDKKMLCLDNGFVVIEAKKRTTSDGDEVWSLHYEFDRETGSVVAKQPIELVP